MTKITLTPLVNLQNETTAVNAINANDAVIVTAFDNTLSRDGTVPNTMGATLDMNSHRIINLPSAISTTEPVTLSQMTSALVAAGNIVTGITGVPVSAAMQPVVAASTTAAALALLTAGGNLYRPLLNADTTWYVSPVGNNSNDGLSAITPFQTIARAIIVSTSYDWNGHNVIIQLADGTYNETVTLIPYIGRATQGHTTPIIQGNASNPSAVIIDGGAGLAAVLGVETVFEWGLKNLKMQCIAGQGILADVGSWIFIDNVVFGPCITHLNASGGLIEVLNNYTVVGNFTNHILCQNRGIIIYVQAPTITISGTPAMAGFFVSLLTQGLITWPFLVTFVGGITGGTKYSVASGGGSNTGGNGMNYFPGASAGTLTSPGWII